MILDLGSCVWVWFLRGMACAIPLVLALLLGRARFVSPIARLWVWRAAIVKCLLEAFGVFSLVPALGELGGPIQEGWSATAGPIRSAIGTCPVAFILPTLIVSLIVLRHLLRQAGQTREWLRSTNLTPNQHLRDRYHEVARAMDCWSMPPLLECPRAHGPLVAGWPKVGLVLPTISADSLHGEEADMLLGHELAHARNRDAFWSVVSWLLIIVFPFQPLAWIAAREQRVVAEEASDHRVVESLDVESAEYAKFLAKASALWRSENVYGLLSAGIVSPANLLLRRVSALEHHAKTSFASALSAIVIGIGVLTPIRFDAPLTWFPGWWTEPTSVPSFDAEILPIPAPFTQSRAVAINSSGQLALNLHKWRVESRGALWAPQGGLKVLEGKGDSPSSLVEAVSNDGTCAGFCLYPKYGGGLSAFWEREQSAPRWTGHPLSTPAGGWANALGRPGEVAGTADSGRAWRQSVSGHRSWLDLPQGWTTWSAVRGGNENGWFCGTASAKYLWQEEAAPQVAILWPSNGEADELGWLPGDTQSFAIGVNRNLTVVGWSGGPARRRAFRWTRQDGMQLLRSVAGYMNSQALKINAKGWIVGSAWNTASDKVGVLWSPDGRPHLIDQLIIKLGSRVLPGSEASPALEDRIDVNDRLQIAATLKVREGIRAAILQPRATPLDK